MVRRMLIAAGAVAIPAWTANAFCVKPTAPYCTTQYGQFSDQDASNRCGSDLDFYRAEIEGYQSCLQHEQEEAVRELQEAVAGFRRRAGR